MKVSAVMRKCLRFATVIGALCAAACGGAVEPVDTGAVVQGVVVGVDDACVPVTDAELAFAMCSNCAAGGGAEWSSVRDTCADAGAWRMRCADVRARWGCP